MSQIPMSEADWNAALGEWKESLEYLGDEVKVPESFAKRVPVSLIEQCREPKKKESGRYIKYVKIGAKETSKAKFFITEAGTPLRGFWCPRGAILEDIGDQVFVANWCTIKTITFN